MIALSSRLLFSCPLPDQCTRNGLHIGSDEPHDGTACLWAVKKAVGGTECSWDYNAITDDAGDEKLRILWTSKGGNYTCGDVPLIPLMWLCCEPSLHSWVFFVSSRMYERN